VVVIAAGGLALLAQATSRRQTSSETYTDISRIELDLANASIRITGGGDRVVVDQRVTSGWLGTTVRHEVSGDTLRLVMRCPLFIGINCRAEFDLQVPGDTELTGRTANGRIEIGDVDGNVDIGTSNGAVELTRLSGTLRANTSNGAIRASDLGSLDVDFRTSNGRIEVDASQPPDRIVARTSNGRIEIALPSEAPPYAVDASTSNGNTQLDIRTDPASAHRIEARTSNGSITIRYR
jgi:hypothetical protein